ncbi:hypothetical protein BDV25DRAFT_139356 [Aspergillus avenaceus]|uniref:Zn(2)-C6 fungal-type domain-containing protein n=1 Tax=Aspergillus avenaceus TaxID=36643 RepID=A0A5N6TXX3_ASPAV|nr:hypothetical protein BDV25DRAFT_139356 [Aspergillus avenaceus]
MKRRQSSRRHACVRCVELKVRCSIKDGEDECQRCSRLGSRCVFPNIAPQTRNLKSKSRLDNLQNQIDELRNELVDGATNVSTRSAGEVVSSHANDTCAMQPRPICTGAKADTSCDPLRDGILTVAQANLLLDKFRAVKMPKFPFVIIPEKANAISLQQESPFLFSVLMAVSTEDPPDLQDQLDRVVKQNISNRLIMGCERNIDILSGLLVYTAWYHYQWKTIMPQIYLFLQMTVTLVADLGLDREANFTMSNIAAGLRRSTNVYQQTYNHSAAGKRALLGTYYLCSVLSLFRPQLLMRHTAWIDQCCTSLTESPECPSDKRIKQYIDAQRLVRESTEMLSQTHTRFETQSEDWLETFIAHLDSKFGLVGNTSDETYKQSDDYASVFEVQAKPVLVLGQIAYHRNETFKAFEMSQLSALITSTENVILLYPRVPADVATHLPMSQYAYIWYALLVLSKTLLLSDDSWDGKADLRRRVRQAAHHTMAKHDSLSRGDDVWASNKKVVGIMLSWVEGQDNAKENEPQPSFSSQPSSGQTFIADTSPTSHESNINHLKYSDGAENQHHLSASAVPGNGRASDYGENGFQEYLDAVFWQQMLEGPPLFPGLPTSMPESMDLSFFN